MSKAETPEAAGMTSESMIRRTWELLEASHRKSRVELLCAIILSLATTSSAWCAYQSKLWSGVQGARGGIAGGAAAQASQSRLKAMQIRSMEEALIIKIFEAHRDKNLDIADFYSARLPPQTQVALRAWWKTKPLTNPKAPATPFAMDEYDQPELIEAAEHDKVAAEASAAGARAGRNSDTYVLLTVMFASVLFFGGIGGTFSSRRLRRAMMYIALVLFLLTFSVLCMMPVAWDFHSPTTLTAALR